MMNKRILEMIKGNESQYPHALAAQFPHVLSKMMELWNSLEFDPYLEQLMLDSRDHQRQGFPPDVAADIMRLSRINTEQREGKPGKSAR
jgi:hypothetical protein